MAYLYLCKFPLAIKSALFLFLASKGVISDKFKSFRLRKKMVLNSASTASILPKDVSLKWKSNTFNNFTGDNLTILLAFLNRLSIFSQTTLRSFPLNIAEVNVLLRLS